MGANSSQHQPLDRNRNRTSFKRSASLRQSKSKEVGYITSRRMDKLRRSFRDSFKRKKDQQVAEMAKPQLWQMDEMDVRTGACFFNVKYLGCVEVFESRGMQVCEEALRVLKNGRRRPVKAVLHVSGDGLRVVEDDTKGLIVDQTIEKVSFCAPDRNHDRGFSYICRDGTTRRWMCHGFIAAKESGERLSHAVGCAFAICLERKQKRDKECAVTMNFDPSDSTFTRTGSFKKVMITDQLQPTDSINNTETVPPVSNVTTSNNIVIINNNKNNSSVAASINSIISYTKKSTGNQENIPVTIMNNAHAIERPHATISLLQRQCSFRGLSRLNHISPFKRQLSLRLNDLPSNLERTRTTPAEYSNSRTQAPLVNQQMANILSRGSSFPFSCEPPSYQMTESVLAEEQILSSADTVSTMCQKLSYGLSLLSNNDDIFLSSKPNQLNEVNSLINDSANVSESLKPSFLSCLEECEQSTTATISSSVDSSSYSTQTSPAIGNMGERCRSYGDTNYNEMVVNKGLATAINDSMDENITNNSSSVTTSDESVVELEENNVPLVSSSSPSPSPSLLTVTCKLPNPEQWLGKVAEITLSGGSGSKSQFDNCNRTGTVPAPSSIQLHDAELYSLDSPSSSKKSPPPQVEIDKENLSDPQWTAPKMKNMNPFLSSPTKNTSINNSIKAFEVQM